MSISTLLSDPLRFSSLLKEKMTQINPGIAELELYEFRYALDNLTPPAGWNSVEWLPIEQVEALIQPLSFFRSIQLRPRRGKHVILDPQIERLTQILFVGLVTCQYPVDWVNRLFYFDLRGFFFLVRTRYYDQSVLDHFGGKPSLQLEPTHQRFDGCHEIGYREFKLANQAVDQAFISIIQQLIASKGTPLLLTLVGPTAAGKTEIVAQLSEVLLAQGKHIRAIEMDNFLKDREFRDQKGMNQEAIHFELFKQSMEGLLRGEKVSIPSYDFIHSTSSHDLNSVLRPGRAVLEIEPAEIILLEGNFPFHLSEIAPLIDIKVVYLTDDPIRLKRKWARDIDYRKKYEPVYFCNRYFSTQRMRAEEIYLPLMAVSDLVVDTTAAALWAAPEISSLLRDKTRSTPSPRVP